MAEDTVTFNHKGEPVEKKNNTTRLSETSSTTVEENRKKSVDILKTALKERLKEHDPDTPKVIMVWGSGASVRSGLVTGTDIGKHLHKTIEEAIGKDEKRKNIDLQSLMSEHAKLFGLDELYKHLTSSDHIPRDLNKSPPYFPSFSHEFCAHLAKTGVLTNFISLNLDEVLESALINELNPENIHTVASEGDFERYGDQLTQQPAWKPPDRGYQIRRSECFVFKPYGTISRKSSLCQFATNIKGFEVLSDAKVQVLSNVMNENNTVFVFLGVGKGHKKFWDLCRASTCINNASEIIMVGSEPLDIELFGENYEKPVFFRGCVTDFFVDLLNSLYDEQEDYKLYTQRPTRHYLRYLLFNLFSRKVATIECTNFGSELKPKISTELAWKRFRLRRKQLAKIPRAWYDLRVYELELLMHLIKNRGLFNQVSAYVSPRLIKAYMRCVEQLKLTNKESLERDLRAFPMLSFLNEGDELLFSSNVVDGSGKPIINTEWCFLIFPKSQRETLEDDCSLSSKKLDEIYDCAFEAITDKYLAHLKSSIKKISLDIDEPLCQNLDAELLDGRMKVLREEFAKNFKVLFSDFEVDVVETHPVTMLRFEEPRLLATRRDLIDKGYDLLGTGWDTLRIITSSGEWFDPKKITQPIDDKRIIEVIADLDVFKDKQTIKSKRYELSNLPESARTATIAAPLTLHYINTVKKIAEQLEEISTLGETTVYWHLHRQIEHHLTIATTERSSLKQQHGVVYNHRPDKRSFVSSVRLNKSEDVDSAIRYFESLSNDSTCKNHKNPVHWISDDTSCGCLFTAHLSQNNIKLVMNQNSKIARTFADTIKRFNTKISIDQPKVQN